MKTYVNCTKFTPTLAKVSAVLIAAVLAGLSAESAAQAPSANPSSAVAWIQKDAKGDRYVYYKKADGSTASQGPVTAAAPTGPTDPNKPKPLCVYTSYIWVC